MERSVGTGTMRSQINAGKSNNTKIRQQQRTATSNRTGAMSSSAQTTSAHHRVIEKQRPKIFDEMNNDVTPKPLFGDADSVTKTRHTSGIFHSIEGTSTPTDILSNGSMLNTNAILTGVQSFGAFFESSMHLSTSGGDSNQQATHQSSSSQDHVDREETATSAHFYATNIDGKEDLKEPQEGKPMEEIGLSETNTFFLLNIPSICISDEDTIKVENIKKLNQKYLEACKNKAGNDSYVDRGMNTFDEAQKLKSTQTDRICINEKGVVCTQWDIYDSYKNKEEAEKDDDSDSILDDVEINQNSNKDLAVKVADANFEEISEPQKLDSSQDKTNLLLSEEFKKNLFFMERFINSNIYQPKQAIYRGIKNLFNLDEEPTSKLIQQYDGISLEKLWSYNCSLSRDRNVSCLTWNRKNKDILAAGYGKFEYNDEMSGLVCCWSIKNTEFPERYYHTSSGVTSLAFSQKYPNLLAVGLFSGNILVYDVRNNNTKPLITTNESDHKHLSPVWNLKWSEKERSSSNDDSNPSEMEVLISISSDGRVTQWMIRKGFESTDYLKLKRIGTNRHSSLPNKTNSKEKESRDTKSDGLISRHAGGLCFDVWDQDKSIYLCGTEEGFIHRCSTSYNEQYLETYKGHTGPVYKLAWSPFLKSSFLSASGDWTIKLWKLNRNSPCLTFSSSSKAVYDISWSPDSATLFCGVNENAIELWDLSKSTLDPIYTTTPAIQVKLTTVGFSPNSDSLVVGSSDGNLCIYGIKNKPQRTTEADLEEIIKHSLISQLENFNLDDEELEELTEKYKQDPIVGVTEITTNEQEQKEKFDAIETKLNKIKTENAKLLEKNEKIKPEKKKVTTSKPNTNETSSDEN